MRADYRTIEQVAKDAALREHAPGPGEGRIFQDARSRMYEKATKEFSSQLVDLLRDEKLFAINIYDGAPFDPASEEVDIAAWCLSRSEREKALELLGQLVHRNEAGHISSILQSSVANAVAAQEKRSRQERGFYTMREAAELISDSGKRNAAKLLATMHASFKSGDLTVRDPETEAPLSEGHCRDFYDWVTAGDMDAMLRRWGVAYSFPGGQPSGNSLREKLLEEEARQRATLKAKRLEEQLLDGGYFIDEAAEAISEQLGRDDSFTQRLISDMKRCGSLVDGHPNKLVVRDFSSRIQISENETAKLFHVVRQADVNMWLDATGAGYRWGVGGERALPERQRAQPEVDEELAIKTMEPKIMKKAALINALRHEWPDIEAHLSEAGRNGLKSAAHAGKHGMWDEAKARDWASSRGKLRLANSVLPSVWPTPPRRHTIAD